MNIGVKRVKLVVLFRSGHLEVFCKKGVLSNFAKFTGKHLCQRAACKKLYCPVYFYFRVLVIKLI